MAARKASDFASYTAAAPAFARPVLKKVRALWRKAAPDAGAVMKWSSPFFEGNSLLGGMAAFKAHVNLTLWNAGAIEGAGELFPTTGRTGMGHPQGRER